MLKQYFVVCNYITDIVDPTEVEDKILNLLANDLSNVLPGQMINVVRAMFNVIEGEEIEIEDENGED